MSFHKPILAIAIIISLIFLIGNVFAMSPDYIFKTKKQATIEIPIFENDISKCTTCSCTITINYPNGSNMIQSGDTDISNNYAVYFINVSDVTGIYVGDLHCSNGADNGGTSFSFEVNPLGKTFTTAQGILYVLIFILTFILFLLCLLFGLSPSGNKKDEITGYILAVDNVKYLKIFSIAIAYLMILLMAYFGWMISYGYLDLDFLGSMFNFVFYFLLIALFPLFVVGVFIVIANAIRDHKVGEMLSRGLHVR